MTYQGKDIIALAETGSGKTLAFTLPILQSLLESPKPFYALVLSPTRYYCFVIFTYILKMLENYVFRLLNALKQ